MRILFTKYSNFFFKHWDVWFKQINSLVHHLATVRLIFHMVNARCDCITMEYSSNRFPSCTDAERIKLINMLTQSNLIAITFFIHVLTTFNCVQIVHVCLFVRRTHLCLCISNETLLKSDRLKVRLLHWVRYQYWPDFHLYNWTKEGCMHLQCISTCATVDSLATTAFWHKTSSVLQYRHNAKKVNKPETMKVGLRRLNRNTHEISSSHMC